MVDEVISDEDDNYIGFDMMQSIGVGDFVGESMGKAVYGNNMSKWN